MKLFLLTKKLFGFTGFCFPLFESLYLYPADKFSKFIVQKMSRNEPYVLYGAAKGFVFNWQKMHLHFASESLALSLYEGAAD
jgi:hypothetical protein